MTFQLGDTVRIIKSKPKWEHWTEAVDRLMKECGTVTSIYHQTEDHQGVPHVRVDGGWWACWVPNECLELVTAAPQELTITEPLQDYERF